MTTKTNQEETRRILTPAERGGLQTRLQEEASDRRAERRNLYVPEDAGMDPTVKATNRRIARTLQRGEAAPLNKFQKQRLEKRKAQLVDWVSKRMVPKDHVRIKQMDDPLRFRKYVNEMAKNENSKEFSQVAQELKNICRRLDPEDPNAANLEQFRPDMR